MPLPPSGWPMAMRASGARSIFSGLASSSFITASVLGSEGLINLDQVEVGQSRKPPLVPGPCASPAPGSRPMTEGSIAGEPPWPAPEPAV